jgi:hypothetical protein
MTLLVPNRVLRRHRVRRRVPQAMLSFPLSLRTMVERGRCKHILRRVRGGVPKAVLRSPSNLRRMVERGLSKVRKEKTRLFLNLFTLEMAPPMSLPMTRPHRGQRVLKKRQIVSQEESPS